MQFEFAMSSYNILINIIDICLVFEILKCLQDRNTSICFTRNVNENTFLMFLWNVTPVHAFLIKHENKKHAFPTRCF